MGIAKVRTEDNNQQRTEEVSLAQPYSFVVSYSKNDWNYLSNLCDKYGSDKGQTREQGHPYSWKAHTYTDFYARHFDHCRQHVTKVFECGIGSNNIHVLSNMGIDGKPGASLRVWRDYFTDANIYAGDIDRETLFQEDRIHTAFLDQTDRKSIDAFWDQFDEVDFDLMIDDGLHSYEAGISLFEGSIDRLAYSGIYVIEDVGPHELQLFEKYFSDKPYQVDFIQMHRPDHPLFNNSLVVIRK